MAGPSRRGAGLQGPRAGRPWAIISATRVNAELFGLEAEIGTIEVGKRADLLLLAGQPLHDIALVAEPDNVTLVMRTGVVAKDREGRLA